LCETARADRTISAIVHDFGLLIRGFFFGQICFESREACVQRPHFLFGGLDHELVLDVIFDQSFLLINLAFHALHFSNDLTAKVIGHAHQRLIDQFVPRGEFVGAAAKTERPPTWGPFCIKDPDQPQRRIRLITRWP